MDICSANSRKKIFRFNSIIINKSGKTRLLNATSWKLFFIAYVSFRLNKMCAIAFDLKDISQTEIIVIYKNHIVSIIIYSDIQSTIWLMQMERRQLRSERMRLVHQLDFSVSDIRKYERGI